MSKSRTYVIPVVHHLTFGVEVEVEATSLKQAKNLALDPKARIVNDGYDWNRQCFTKATLGDWQNITSSPTP